MYFNFGKGLVNIDKDMMKYKILRFLGFEKCDFCKKWIYKRLMRGYKLRTRPMIVSFYMCQLCQIKNKED